MYKLLLSLFCFLSIIETSCLQAYQSAHVISVGVDTDKNGTITKKYVLFGLLKNGMLSTFGGLRDPGENDPKDTAAREAEEEALGVLGSQQAIRNLLKGLTPCFEVDGHLCYVLPSVNYGKNVSKDFKKIRFNKKINLSNSQKEMVAIVAVNVDKIREKIFLNKPLRFKDNEGKYRPIRFEPAIRKAVMGGYL